MIKTTDNTYPPGPRSTEAAPTPLEKDRHTFLTYLLPIKKQLYNFVQKASNFSPDADDLFQETLLKGFRYFHSFDHGRKFKTWIFTIAHNLMKDAFREKQLRHWAVPLEAAEDITAVDYPVSAALSADVREIYAVVAHLKPRQREVFFLYYYNEFNISEIAAITGLSRANIKFILHQARKTIKKILEVRE
jgi:RNA polymerase sigma-70 factor (ECF subfamily)